MLLTHAFALFASQFVHKKKSLRIYTSMHSGGLELTKLTYSRHEDNLLLHRGDRTLLYNTLVVLTSIHSLVNRQERVFFSFLSSLSTFDDLPFCCLSPKAISFGRICDQWYHEERKKERVFFSFVFNFHFRPPILLPLA